MSKTWKNFGIILSNDVSDVNLIYTKSFGNIDKFSARICWINFQLHHILKRDQSVGICWTNFQNMKRLVSFERKKKTSRFDQKLQVFDDLSIKRLITYINSRNISYTWFKYKDTFILDKFSKYEAAGLYMKRLVSFEKKNRSFWPKSTGFWWSQYKATDYVYKQ